MHRIFRLVHIVAALALLFAVLPTSVQAQTETFASPPGTAAGFTMLADIMPGSESGMEFQGMYQAVAFGNKVFFLAKSPTKGIEPWITDGTPAGTVMLRDTVPGAVGVYEDASWDEVTPVTWNGKVFFQSQGIGSGGTLVPQLWVSNGTAAGTVAVANAYHPIQEFKVGTTGVMFLEHYSGNFSVWWTDGTAQNTFLVRKWAGEINDGRPAYAQFGQAVYINADNKLLKVDLQTRQVVLTVADQVEDIIGVANNLVFFSRYTPAYGTELWQTNGTAAGTVLVGNLSVSVNSTQFHPDGGVVLGNSLAFIAAETTLATSKQGVYITSGSASGITKLYVTPDFYVRRLQVSGNELYFQVSVYSILTLWRSDGTPQGTRNVCLTCQHQGYYSTVVPLSTQIIYDAQDSAGTELWVTNGTDDGTHRLSDLNPGSNDANPVNLLALNGYVFFTANDGVHGEEPWVYRPVQTRMTANHDKFTVVAGQATGINVRANDVHEGGLPIQLVGFDATGIYGGKITRHTRGTPADLTDDVLIYTSPMDKTIDEFAYWIDDGSGKTTMGRVTITIAPPPADAPPSDVVFVPAGDHIYEDELRGTYIGFLSVTDPNQYQHHDCVMHDGFPFEILDSDKIYTNGILDYEAFPTGYTVKVTCTDPTNKSITKDVVIPVENVNEQPSLVAAEIHTLTEDEMQQEWEISWHDPENNVNSVTLSPTRSYASLVNCVSGTCKFRYQPVPNFVGKETYTLKATDSGNLSVQKQITITVNPGNNDLPLMKPIPTIVRQNETKTYQLKLEGISAGPYETEPVTLSVETDNTAMLPFLLINHTGGTEGMLDFTVNPEGGREAQVTITLDDGVNQVDYTFKVIVTDNPPIYLPILRR